MDPIDSKPKSLISFAAEQIESICLQRERRRVEGRHGETVKIG